jgi:hypothetical protein
VRPTRFAGGLRTSSDSFVDQAESDRLRDVLAFQAREWSISTLENVLHTADVVQTAAFDLAVASMLGVRYCGADVVVSRARIAIDVGVAGAKLETCLYTKTPNKGNVLRLVPGTTASFDVSAATTPIDVALDRPVTVPAGAIAYVGYTFSGPGLPTMEAVRVWGCSVTPLRSLASGAAALPLEAHLDEWATATALYAPVVTYYGPLLEDA